MSKILIIAEHLGGKLNTATARAVSAAIAVAVPRVRLLAQATPVLSPSKGSARTGLVDEVRH